MRKENNQQKTETKIGNSETTEFIPVAPLVKVNEHRKVVEGFDVTGFFVRENMLDLDDVRNCIAGRHTPDPDVKEFIAAQLEKEALENRRELVRIFSNSLAFTGITDFEGQDSVAYTLVLEIPHEENGEVEKLTVLFRRLTRIKQIVYASCSAKNVIILHNQGSHWCMTEYLSPDAYANKRNKRPKQMAGFHRQ